MDEQELFPQQFAEQFAQQFNLGVQNSNSIARAAEKPKSSFKLIEKIRSGRVDVNVVLWPDDRIFFVALRNKNMLLLQFLLSQTNLEIDQSKLELLLPNFFSDYNSGRDDEIILLLANSSLVAVPLLNLAIINRWLTVVPELVTATSQQQYLTQPDRYGKTALDYAYVPGLNSMIKLLLLNNTVKNIQIKNYDCNIDRLFRLMADKPDETRKCWLLEADLAMSKACLILAYVMAIREGRYKITKPNSRRGRYFNILLGLPDETIEIILLRQQSDKRDRICKQTLSLVLQTQSRQFFD